MQLALKSAGSLWGLCMCCCSAGDITDASQWQWGVKWELQGKPSIFLKLSVSMPLVESKEGFELKLILGIDGVQVH